MHRWHYQHNFIVGEIKANRFQLIPYPGRKNRLIFYEERTVGAELPGIAYYLRIIQSQSKFLIEQPDKKRRIRRAAAKPRAYRDMLMQKYLNRRQIEIFFKEIIALYT